MSIQVRARVATGALAALVLTGCAGASTTPASSSSEEPAAVSNGAASAGAQETSLGGGALVALTYDGGLLVLDGTDLTTIADLPKDGFLRLNGAGDRNGHVLVTTAEGFQVLDTGLTSGAAKLTDIVFPADTAGHVTPHAGRTALFADGTGDITLFDSDELDGTTRPAVETIKSAAAHHGVAIELSDGTVLATIGTSESRSGVRVLDQHRNEIARNEQCPGVHGEGAVADEVVMFGCEDGVLLVKDGSFVKLAAPDEYGRIGNAYVTDSSAVAVGDYGNDPDHEGYLLSDLAFIDTRAETLKIVDVPGDGGYTWRDVGRDAHNNAIVLSSDGSLYKLDESGAVIDSWKVIAPWQGPVEWQDPHPALKVVGDVAYVTEPAANRILAIDLESGRTLATGSLAQTPNEIAVVDRSVS